MQAKKKAAATIEVATAASTGEMLSKSVAAATEVGKAADLLAYARWCREKYERRFGASMTREEREDFEGDAVVTMLETFAEYGVTLRAGSSLHAKVIWREAGIEHIRRRAVVNLTEHAVNILGAIRNGTVGELEQRRRARLGQKIRRGGVKDAAQVLGRIDVFSRAELPGDEHGDLSGRRGHSQFMGAAREVA